MEQYILHSVSIFFLKLSSWFIYWCLQLLDGSTSGMFSPLQIFAAASDVHQNSFCCCYSNEHRMKAAGYHSFSEKNFKSTKKYIWDYRWLLKIAQWIQNELLSPVTSQLHTCKVVLQFNRKWTQCAQLGCKALTSTRLYSSHSLMQNTALFGNMPCNL